LKLSCLFHRLSSFFFLLDVKKRDNVIVAQPIPMDDLTHLYTAEVKAIIDDSLEANKPFFIHIAYDAPHVPLFAAPEFQGTSKRGLYGDMVEEMDFSIGQIVEHLEANNVADNTLIFFTSDNGAWVNPNNGLCGEPFPYAGGMQPFRDGKGSTWDGGVHVLGLAYWPKVIARHTHSLAGLSQMDFFNTIAEAAGIDLETRLSKDLIVDGRSLMPIFTATTQAARDFSPHDYLYFYREGALGAVREGGAGGLKGHLVTRSGFDFLDQGVKHDPPMLFDVLLDPAESDSLPAEEQGERLARMQAAIEAHKAAMVPGRAQYNKPQGYGIVRCLLDHPECLEGLPADPANLIKCVQRIPLVNPDPVCGDSIDVV
jgi:arylsulfatase A